MSYGVNRFRWSVLRPFCEGLLDNLYVGERSNVTSLPRGHCLKGSHRSAVGLRMQVWLGLVDLVPKPYRWRTQLQRVARKAPCKSRRLSEPLHGILHGWNRAIPEKSVGATGFEPAT
jgi:hypothetical protein